MTVTDCFKINSINSIKSVNLIVEVIYENSVQTYFFSVLFILIGFVIFENRRCFIYC